MPLFLLVLTRIKLKYLDPPLELKIELFNIGWKVDIFLSFSLYMYNFVKNISTLVGTYDFLFYRYVQRFVPSQRYSLDRISIDIHRTR